MVAGPRFEPTVDDQNTGNGHESRARYTDGTLAATHGVSWDRVEVVSK